MKKTTLLKSMLLLCALIVGSLSSWATEATFNWALGGNMGSNATGKVNNITLTGTANSASNAPSVTSNTLRVYAHRSSGNGASATFTADDGYKISAIEVTSSNGGTILKYSADGGDFTSFSWTDGVATVSELNVSSITLKNCQSSGSSNTTIQISKVIITYAASGSTPSSGASFANTTPSLDLKDATSFTQTATTASGYSSTPGASVTYSITENNAGASINSSTGEVTPTQTGTVTVQASAAAITGKYLASTATYTLTVTDTREWTVTCHTGDTSDNVVRTSGATLSLDNPSSLYGMSFIGWSSTNNAASPTWVANTTKVTGNMELWAMYEAVAGAYSYHLVEADQADWRGDYLIAYSSSVFANGQEKGTNGIGAASTVVNPSSNLSEKVVTSSWGDDYYVTLEAIDDDDLSKGYLLKTQDDYYNYQTSDANGIGGTSNNKATASAYPITIDYESSSEINITLDKGQVFRYNTSEKYFRYYKSSSYSNQGKVYLYKRTMDVAPVYSLGTSLGTEETVTIGASKYASYCSDKALNFSETDVKAYKAKVDEGKVVLTLVNYVPANTGVVLYCATANDYDVPVIDNAAVVTENELIGVTSRTLVEWETGGDGKYNYILQQGAFKKAAAGGYLKANRAYLHTAYNVTSPGAHDLEMVFDGEQGDVTGIKNLISTTSKGEGVAYNLAGQRVNASHKGIVIVNGKKYLNK